MCDARGDEVALNESLNVVLSRAAERQGEIVTLREVLDMSRGTSHGTIDGLSDDDLDALVAYVATL